MLLYLINYVIKDGQEDKLIKKHDNYIRLQTVHVKPMRKGNRMHIK